MSARIYGVVVGTSGETVTVRPSIGFDGTITGRSIKRTALADGSEVDIIQCYNHGSPTNGFGFVEKSYGIGSIIEPQSALQPAIAEDNYAQAGLWYLCAHAGKAVVKFKIATVLFVFPDRLTVRDWSEGYTHTIGVSSDLTASQFTVGDDVLIRAFPLQTQEVIGWWRGGVTTSEAWDTVSLPGTIAMTPLMLNNIYVTFEFARPMTPGASGGFFSRFYSIVDSITVNTSILDTTDNRIFTKRIQLGNGANTWTELSGLVFRFAQGGFESTEGGKFVSSAAFPVEITLENVTSGDTLTTGAIAASSGVFRMISDPFP